MDGNAKHDLERASEQATRASYRGIIVFSVIFRGLAVRLNRFYHKRFSSSMRALKKDGPTKELAVSPPLTIDEAKKIVAKARESDTLIGVKKMQPDGGYGRNHSLRQQEKMAKYEIRASKWKDRKEFFRKIGLISNFALKREQRNRTLSKEENEKNKDVRYQVICNKAKIDFMNARLEEIQKDRISQKTRNELEDINKDGVIDDKDFATLESRDMDLKPIDLNKIGEDYGSCLVSEYKSNYCKQAITKEEYCAIRGAMFKLKSHGAIVRNEDEVLIAIHSSDLEEYRKYAPSDKPIKEYGASGARAIETESNINDLISLEIANQRDFKVLRERYREKDFMAEHNPDGTISVLVKETDTKEIVQNSKKKSSTEELLKEANEVVQKTLERATNKVNDIVLPKDDSKDSIDLEEGKESFDY